MPEPEIPERPRLAVVRPDRVGDVIISSSCFRAIHARWPGVELAWLIRPGMAPLFQSHPRIGKLILLPEPAKVSWRARFVRVKRELREFGPDAVVFLQPDSACQVAAWAAKIPRRLGYAKRGWSWTLTEALSYDKSEGKKHEAEYNFDLLGKWGLPCPEGLRNDIVVPGESGDSLRKKVPWEIGRTAFAVLNPSAFSPVARWPVAHFVALAERLLEEEGLHLVLTGDSEEDPSAREIGRNLAHHGGRILNLAGRTSLGELGFLLREAQVLVTRDTGPSHLAAGVGCPVTVIFGRTDPIYGPGRWRPLGERVEVLEHRLTRQPGEKREAFWQRCFASITPEEVWESLNRVRIRRN